MARLRVTDKLSLHADLRCQRIIDHAMTLDDCPKRPPGVSSVRSVLFAMINRSDYDGRCVAKDETIGEDSESSPKTVQRVMDLLELAGLIEERNRDRGEAQRARQRGRDSGYFERYIVWHKLLPYVKHVDRWSDCLGDETDEQVDQRSGCSNEAGGPTVHMPDDGRWTNGPEHVDHRHEHVDHRSKAGGPSTPDAYKERARGAHQAQPVNSHFKSPGRESDGRVEGGGVGPGGSGEVPAESPDGVPRANWKPRHCLIVAGLDIYAAERIEKAIFGNSSDPSTAELLALAGFDDEDAEHLAATYTRARIVGVFKSIVQKIRCGENVRQSVTALMTSWLKRSKPHELTELGRARLSIGQSRSRARRSA